MLDLLGFGALVLEMNLPHADAERCACYHPHGECVTCGCPLLAAAASAPEDAVRETPRGKP